MFSPFFLLSLLLPIHLVNSYQLGAYYASWFQYFNSPPRLQPLCASYKYDANNVGTVAPLLDFINYAFVKIDSSGNIFPVEYNDCQQGRWPGCQGWDASQDMFAIMNSVARTANPKIKLLHSYGGFTIGGVNIHPIWSLMMSSVTARTNFITQAINFARTFSFDGIDIDDEYPANIARGGVPADTQNFFLLLKELRAAINNEVLRAGQNRLLLTIATGASMLNIQGTRPQDVHPFVDWINIMTYDLHGPWDPVTGFNTPMRSPAGDTSMFSVTETLDNYINLGIPLNKLNLGMASYGRTFTLAANSICKAGQPIVGSGPLSIEPCSNPEDGLLSYYEAELLIKNNPAYVKSYDSVLGGTQVCNLAAKVWFSYDDLRSIEDKINLTISKGIGGAFFWTMCQDGILDNPKYPLIRKVRTSFNSVSSSSSSSSSSSTGGISPVSSSSSSSTGNNYISSSSSSSSTGGNYGSTGENIGSSGVNNNTVPVTPTTLISTTDNSQLLFYIIIILSSLLLVSIIAILLIVLCKRRKINSDKELELSVPSLAQPKENMDKINTRQSQSESKKNEELQKNKIEVRLQ